jgi:Protein of unknown function (DUF3631)
MPPKPLDASLYERARTWLHEIVVTARPEGIRWTEEDGGDRKYENNGGLTVNLRKNCWYSFGSGVGGYSPHQLLRFLRPEYSSDEAWTWLAAFLAAHPGTGSGADDSDADDEHDGGDAGARAHASAATAREILDRIIPVFGTAAETYLKSRGLFPPYPENLIGFAPEVRIGEGALIGLLTENERTAGVTVTYLTPDGRKSRVLPRRRRFNLGRSRGAAFRIPPPPGTLAGPIDKTADYCACEGLEDALTLRRFGRAWTIIGVPGISFLGDIKLPKGARLTVVKDGDLADSAAAAALIRGVDSQLLNGVRVRITPTADHEDANRVLLHWGPDALNALVMQATEASLSFDGRIRGLVRLDAGVAFEQERAAIAKIFKVRVGAVDDAVKRLRPKPAAAQDAGGAGDSEPVFVPDEPWTAPVDLVAMLNALYAELGHYIWQPEAGATVATLWSALTHTVHNSRVNLQVCSKLHITSSLPDCGKTLLLEILAEVVHRGMLAGSYTGSSIFRLVHAMHPTLLLDEADQVLADPKGDLSAILNSSHRRRTAVVWRSEQDENGKWLVKAYSVWGAAAFAGIGQLPPTLASRSISNPLQRALPEAGARLKHLRDGTSLELVEIRRQLAAWGAALDALPEPEMPPGFNNRLGDNWRPLFAIAELAGEVWPERIRAAAEAARAQPQRPPLRVRLLASIREAFGEDARLSTPELIARLTSEDMASEGWDEANRGKPISAWWLRERLDDGGGAGLLHPRGSQDWYDGVGGARRHVRGYLLSQFEDAFRRYLSSPLPVASTGSSGSSGSDPAFAADLLTCAEPDADISSGSPISSGSAGSARKISRLAAAEPVEPVEPVEATSNPPAADKVTTGSLGSPTGSAAAANGEDREAAASGPNGPVPKPERRTGMIESIIRQTRAENPSWSIAQIAKRVGRAPSVVKRILGEEAAQGHVADPPRPDGGQP